MKLLIEKMTSFYHNLGLRTKFTITHLIITTLPVLVMCLFFYGKLYDLVLADTIHSEQTASTGTIPQIEGILNRLLDVRKELKDHPFFKNPMFSVNAPSSPSSKDFCRQADEVIDHELITDVLIYMDLPKSQPIFTDSGTSRFFRSIDEARGSYWFGIFKGSPSYTSLFCPQFYLSPYEVEHSGDMAYITKFTVWYDRQPRICYMAVYYSQNPLTRLLSGNMTADTSVAYIINDRDSTVATSDQALAGIYHFSYDTVWDSFMSSDNFILKRVLDQDVYAGFYHIQKADWFMVAVIPSGAIINKTILILMGFLLVYLMCVLTALLIAARLSHSITDRISAVIGQMTKVRTGPPVALPNPDRHDEIGSLIDTYNYMTRVMNQLISNQAKAAEDLRIAEFHSLQAQINPHFLYNTMDMINWMALQGRTEEVSEAIMDLSRFYKLTLSRKETISTIADEMEHVSIYVRLQNMRYRQLIDFVCDIPDGLMDQPIPKLTFQPVVENAILHGILEKVPKGGTIVLTGWTEQDTVVILISDDGVGIPPEKLDTILSGKGISKTGTNIAIYNTHRRIQLLYGNEYGLRYKSVLGKGTDVEIRLPGGKDDA